jgi:AcrR family transcriptional regulator
VTVRTRQPRMPIEVRREQVLDAALRLIERDGYAATTVEAIAREADLAKPVVYKAYPGREPLLRALLEREQARAFATLARAVPAEPEGSGPRAMLLAWLGNLARAISENPRPWRLMFLPPEGTPPLVRKYVQRGRDLALEQAKALVGALLDERPELASVDRELAARTFLAAAEHAAGLLIRDPGEYPPERLVAFVASLLPSDTS